MPIAEDEEECPPAGAPGWMVTFADLMALLLVLFVLLLTFAEMNVIRYKSIIGSIKEAFGVARKDKLAGVIELEGTMQRSHATNVDPTRRPEKVTEPTSVSMAMPTLSEEDLEKKAQAEREEQAEALKQQLEQAIHEKTRETRIKVERRGDEVVMRFPSEIAFPSGSAELTADFRQVLASLAPVVKGAPGQVLVSGHTDNVPVSGGAYRSNWDLSAVRAATVMLYLARETGIPSDRFTIQGYGDSRPLQPNTTTEGRAANRRVEVSIVRRMGGGQ